MDALSLTLLWACSGAGNKPGVDSGGGPGGSSVPDTGDSPAPDSGAGDTGPLVDEDGDGFGPERDCDDQHPWTWPGAEEWCDGSDHDCDGETLEEGVCGKAQEMLGLAALTATGPAGYIDIFGSYGFVGDLDADGDDELVTLCTSCDKPDGSRGYVYGLIPGGADWGWGLDGVGMATQEFTDQGFEGVGAVEHLDFNGDGWTDLALVSAGATVYKSGHSAEYLGVAYLLEGPSSAWPDVGALDDVATRTWYEYGTWAQHSATPGDLDGDGYDDLVLATTLSGDPNITPHIEVVFGEPSPTSPVDVWGAEEFATVVYGDDWLGDSFGSGDFDGDGVADLLVNDYHDTVYVVSGPALRASDGARIEDVAYQAWTDEASCVTGLGDWNDDGYDDWMAGFFWEQEWFTDGGALYFVEGAPDVSSGGTWETGAASTIYGTASSDKVGADCRAGDFDGDGRQEFLGERMRDGLSSWFFLRAEALEAGTTPLEESLGLARALDYPRIAPQNPSFGDWDGDGYLDLHLDRYDGGQAEGPGGFAIIPGWDVPWDEEAWW